ncbi:hypothetical protein LJR235_001613 [Pararhizobium sp. LjRoot235]|uniref:hypothetical protein n=1 Tax=Pararhizobium sp. LjRoot235 TaxID=3342291 RepID=UPI003ECF10E9
MPLAAHDLISSNAFFAAMRLLATELTAMFDENPRLMSIFASHQRWLMAQLGLSLHYRRDPGDPAKGLYARRFVAAAVEHRIASRNTAAAFIQEMLAYRFARHSDNPPNNRMRPLEPTDVTVQSVVKWLYAHLSILDHLDGGARAAVLAEDPALFARLQPAIARGILESAEVRNPGETFNLFTWANSGGVVMDCFIAMIEDFDPDAARTLVGPISPADICDRYMISKTHLKRLLNKAAAVGSVGFENVSGRNALWLSQGFVREYLTYQAEKFAIIDAAFHRQSASAPAVRELTAVP